jgi:hypothetical protein
VKRVAAAVGEGAQVVAALHAYLAGSEPNLAPADIKSSDGAGPKLADEVIE